MTFSLYEATVPTMIQMLGAAQNWIGKAKDSNVPEADVVGARLAEDMLPFAYQVKSMVTHSVGAIEGVRKGTFSPNMDEPPQTLEDLRLKLGAAENTLRAIAKGEIDSFIGGETHFVFEPTGIDLPFASEDFLLSFSQPNFFFHATTAYAILRHLGLDVGKRDYIGVPRMKKN